MSWEVRGSSEKPLLHLWSAQFNLTRRVLAITDHSASFGFGDDLSPELVAKSGFGTEIYALRRVDAGTGPATGEVESLLTTLWYCE